MWTLVKCVVCKIIFRVLLIKAGIEALLICLGAVGSSAFLYRAIQEVTGDSRIYRFIPLSYITSGGRVILCTVGIVGILLSVIIINTIKSKIGNIEPKYYTLWLLIVSVTASAICLIGVAYTLYFNQIVNGGQHSTFFIIVEEVFFTLLFSFLCVSEFTILCEMVNSVVQIVIGCLGVCTWCVKRRTEQS